MSLKTNSENSDSYEEDDGEQKMSGEIPTDREFEPSKIDGGELCEVFPAYELCIQTLRTIGQVYNNRSRKTCQARLHRVTRYTSRGEVRNSTGASYGRERFVRIAFILILKTSIYVTHCVFSV